MKPLSLRSALFASRRRRGNLLLLIALVALIAPSQAQETAIASGTPARLAWWRDARFGMFIHWGPVSLVGTEISWSRGGERRGIGGTGEIPLGVYDSLYTRFDPVRFDAAEWVAIARTAGMKYMVLTAKHCDGFCLWRSDVDDYSMRSTPSGRDIAGELARAAHESGMRIGWYYSPMDWRDPDCRTERNETYLRRMRGHLRELLGSYGRIDLLWFDDDGGPIPWDADRTYALVRTMQPGIIINDRLSLGPFGETSRGTLDPRADYRTPEQRVGAFDARVPWETCMTLGTQWSWKPGDKIKTAAECERILVQCATGDGNLLLDVGPMSDGRIEPRQVAVLKEIGLWLAKYGESIYGTRGGPYTNGTWGGATRRGDTLYLHLTHAGGDHVSLPPLPGKILRWNVLTGGRADLVQSGEGVTIALGAAPPDGCETIIRCQVDRSLAGAEPVVVGARPADERIDVTLLTPADTLYPPALAGELADGVRGSTDRTDGRWLAFRGGTCRAEFVLPAGRSVSRVRVGALQEQVSQIFFPLLIEVSAESRDGLFVPAGRLEIGPPVEDAEIRSGEFTVPLRPVTARRFRISVTGPASCPAWHHDAGAKAWLFIDEVTFGE